MGGVLLETHVHANLWVDKPLAGGVPRADEPRPGDGAAGFWPTATTARRTTRWGVEFAALTVPERAMWTRFLFSEARRLGQEAAHREFLARAPRSRVHGHHRDAVARSTAQSPVRGVSCDSAQAITSV